MTKKKKLFIIISVIVILLLLSLSIVISIKRSSNNKQISSEIQKNEEHIEFSFIVVSDMREYGDISQYDDSKYFKGILEDISKRDEAFLIVVGDLDPVGKIAFSIENYLGKDYIWYPVIGNHELPDAGSESHTGENIEFLRNFNLYNVTSGPEPCSETTYSFDYENTHFIVLNEYCNEESDIGTAGDIGDTIYTWLESELKNTNKENIFVIGHEPAYPQPDDESGRLRHKGDSLDQYTENRDRFWDLLVDNSVIAYFCGHTHNYSALEIDGIWQIDAGHARGMGDTEAKSTYIVVSINDNVVEYETFRMNQDTYIYELADSGAL